MRKSQIETRRDRDTRNREMPCINVKVYRWGAYSHNVAEHFGCTDSTAEQACQFHFESVQQRFWEEVQEQAAELWPAYSPKVWSAGRSGGWLVVDGLPEVESWDAIMVGKWSRLARWCREEIAYQFTREVIFDNIESNQWHKDGAELYNFLDRKDGAVVCIADLKQQAIEAGFGAIVRR